MSPHEQWIADGHCPAVHSAGAWCRLKADHRISAHMGHRMIPLHPDGIVPLWWTSPKESV